LGGAAGPAGAAAGGIGGAFVGSYEATQLFDQHAKPQFEKLRDDAAYAQALARYGYTAEEHRHFSAMRQLAREKAAREAEQERARLAQQAAREKQAQLERQRAEEIAKASQARKREEARAALLKQLASKEREPSVASPVKTQPPPRASETTVSPPAPASRPAPPAKAPKDCWVLIETKIYKEKDCTASPGSATVQFPTFKISGSWTSPPAVMKPGETLKFQMSTSFAETGKMIGRYIGGNMEMDQDFVGTRPGYASRNHIVIGTATTDYNLGKLQSSKTGSYTVPKGTPGEKIMIRGLLHIGAPPITGAAYIYEYK
jgi:hypothetical protein